MLRVAEAPQEADRRGVELSGGVDALAQRLRVERAQHAVRAAALGHGDAELGRDERRRMPGAQPVELGACLAAELLDVGEALGREQRGARDLALEQRVRADGHPVHEPLDVSGARARAVERRAHGVEDTLGLVVRSARRLRRDEPVRRGENSVGESSADVYAEYHTADASSGG